MSFESIGGGTSAWGTSFSTPTLAHLLPRESLSVVGTVARNLRTEDWNHVRLPFPQTNAGRRLPIEEEQAQSTNSAIMELRRLSGLTWDQLATLFNVTRRSLHFWASGKQVNAPNEERLRRVLAVVRKADRALLLEDRDGMVPLALLASGAYEDFLDLVGTGPGRRDLKLAPLSPAALEARKPQRPEELAGALQDRVHVDKGKLLSATPIRRPRQE